MRNTARDQPVDLDLLDGFDAIVDVRSPGEFLLDHIPGSSNHPVLDDAERVEVGTLYAQVSAFDARVRGASLVARNIALQIEQHFSSRPRSWRPLVLCWRGGMRSGAMTHVLRSVGWDAVQLPGGYKTWRAHVIRRLEELPGQFQWRVICGPTGSGKSRLLEALAADGAQVLDLEGLAAHRGSVLGALPGQPQPAQRLFESRILCTLRRFDPARPVFVEAESRRIGNLRVPEVLIGQMRESPCLTIDADERARVRLLLEDYRHLLTDTGTLHVTLQRLTELHGRARIDAWSGLVDSGDFGTLVEQLLRSHYDALYRRSSHSNYRQLPQARRLQGGALAPADLARLVMELRDVS